MREAISVLERRTAALAASGLQAQPGALDAHAHHLGPADQHRLGQAFVQHDLHRAQHALVLALGVDHACRLAGIEGLGRGEHRPHQHARLVDMALERSLVSLQVLSLIHI